MAICFPCETMNWEILPAVRREMTSYLVNEKKISRKEVSEKLGLTESAVCQYLKGKRGGNFEFSEINLKKIKKLANNLMKKGYQEKLCFICKELDSPKNMVKKAKNKKTKNKK